MNLIISVFFVLFITIQIFPQEDNITDNKSLIPKDSINIKTPLSLPVYRYNSQNYNPLRKELNYNTLAVAGAAALGIGAWIHIYQQHAWWSGQKVSFHFQNDNKYALNVDKAGHFFGGAFISHLFSGTLEAGNMQSEEAAIWGSALSFAFQMYVEIEDGFGPQWGFSPGDAAADLLGTAFTLGQYYYPFMKNFQVKFSYYPSKNYRNGLHKGNAIDDYEGQKFWLSMRVRNLLPDKISTYWPSWLNIAAGAGIRDLDGSGGGERDLYIGLDFDWESIPLYGNVWQFVKNTFNYIHLPMPGLRINNNTAFFVFLY